MMRKKKENWQMIFKDYAGYTYLLYLQIKVVLLEEVG